MPNPKEKRSLSCSGYPRVLPRFAKKYKPSITRSIAAKLIKSSKKSLQKKRKEAEVVDECVYFIADQKKYPFKRTDIVKKVLPHSPRLFRSIFDRIQEKLLKDYGYKLREVENEKGQFIVLNALDTELDLSNYEFYRRGVLYYILSMIFVRGGSITEDLLWEGLREWHIEVESTASHPALVNVRKYVMEELTKQLYLKAEPIPDTDPLKHKLSWGFRAKCETKKAELLDQVAQLYGSEPEDWVSQFEQLRR